ncbi:MAG: glycoside hydrolase family 127 protein [Phycisphaerae bacterium]|nr:glycoside hydrolase family 127 protein [Phycisphaerae bacterium]
MAEPAGGPAYKVPPAVDDVLTLLPLGSATLQGHIGTIIDTVVRARITSEFARTQIYPETIEAFRKRVDDRMKPQQGFWQGEFWGKWVLGAIAAARYTGNPELKVFVRKAVDELIATQDANGYIGTYHDSAFVRCDGKRMNWNVWCRKYTLWGLVEAYELLGDPNILEAAIRFMDHLMSEVGPGKVPIIETGKFVGLPSTSILGPVVMLYRHTADKHYLDYAEYIVSQWSSRPGKPPDVVNKGLGGKPVHEWFADPGQWTKAYEFISCLEGLLELYRVTGNRRYLQAVVNIYDNIRMWDRSIFGGIGKNDKLLGSARMLQTECEPCDAVYWQRLSVQLLRLTGKSIYADEIERTMYNVLCATMKADGSWGVRRLCLSGAHWPAPKHCQLEHHQCCMNNVPRGLLQLPAIATMSGRHGLRVNLYIEGTAAVPLPDGDRVRLQTRTGYPESGRVRINVSPDKPLDFELCLRIPGWSRVSSLMINDKPGPEAQAGTYARLQRTWKPGDEIELELDMRGRIVRFPDSAQRYVAVERGPIVLARDIRLGDGAIHDPVSLAIASDGFIDLKRASPPDGFWMVFDVPLTPKPGGAAKRIRMCDYSSAGSTWNPKTSDFRVWLPMR